MAGSLAKGVPVDAARMVSAIRQIDDVQQLPLSAKTCHSAVTQLAQIRVPAPPPTASINALAVRFGSAGRSRQNCVFPGSAGLCRKVNDLF